MRTLQVELERYVLLNDLAADTREWYRRVVSVYRGWAKSGEVFDELSISRLLADKQARGRSPYYLKSLRNGLVALLRSIRGDAPIGRVRSVKCPPLSPESWSPAEVARLLSPGCDCMTEGSRFKWQLAILLAYYLSLDRCDVERVELSHFAGTGALVYCRRKTGVALGGGIPVDMLAVIRERCPHRGPICKMHVTPEWFRKVFAGIVGRAGLHGTFKKLRKSSGSLVERQQPGTGHKHCGNSRRIFERHYEDRRVTRAAPSMPPVIAWKPPGQP